MIRGRSTPLGEVARSYGPVLAAALVFVLIAVAVSPSERDEVAMTAAGGGRVVPGSPMSPGPSAPASGLPGEPGTGEQTETPEGGTVGTPPASTEGDPPGPTATAAPAPGGCPDRDLQIPGDPYSPPCVSFAGDNGGATFRGVTDDEIVIAVRQLEGPTAGELFASLSGQPVISSREAVRATYLALGEYFSDRFELYGRRLRLEFYDGQGNGSAELLGAGQEGALSDAVRVAQQIEAFADISAISTPYADALSRQGVVNIGAPYPPSEWFEDRRPYAWSLFPDGTQVVDSLALWLNTRMGPEPTVQFAPQFEGQQRVFGVVGPENPEYQSSGDRFEQSVGGLNIAEGLNYRLDINSMPNQASNIIARLKDSGVTTVVCACDPIMLALGMAPKANEQNYHPEWVTGGLAFVDQDIVSQLVESDQWSRSFGLAFNAEQEPMGRSFPRAAFRAVRPGDEPAFGVEELYYQMYLLAIGIQMAGPNLTPETFEQGMHAYPGGTGPRGTWTFRPGNYTATDDFREIWWDPHRISTQNGQPGAWVEINDGARHSAGSPPSGPAGYFR